MDILPQQLNFCKLLPDVVGNIDYENRKAILTEIDTILSKLEIEKDVVLAFEKKYIEELTFKDRRSADKFLQSFKKRSAIQKVARQTFRASIARHFLQESFRKFTCHLAESELLQIFCGIDHLVRVKIPSKSKLQACEKYFDENLLRSVVIKINDQLNSNKAIDIGLNEKLSLEDILFDSTCIDTNIHFPVDWLLLKDAVRTLIKAVKIIRSHNIKHRIENPDNFLREMNKLCIQMTYTKGADKKKRRKNTLRHMCRISKRVKRHALRYLDLLKKHWKTHGFSEGGYNQIRKRMENILSQLPKAMAQARSRIISEKKIKNEDKILSLYENDTKVVIRKKINAECEFGNKLFLVEQEDGLIIDWEFFKDRVPSDFTLMKPMIERIEENYKNGRIKSACGDRGFDSESNRQFLKDRGIMNCLCSRNPERLIKLMKSKKYKKQQKRRSETEARIGIVKTNFIGSPMRCKGFASRSQGIAFAILTHNLWVVARLALAARKEKIAA